MCIHIIYIYIYIYIYGYTVILGMGSRALIHEETLSRYLVLSYFALETNIPIEIF